MTSSNTPFLRKPQTITLCPLSGATLSQLSSSSGKDTVPRLLSSSSVTIPIPVAVNISAQKLPSPTTGGGDASKDFIKHLELKSLISNYSNNGGYYSFINTFPLVDWKETPQAHLFKVELPGMKKTEVKVELVEGRSVKISGEKSCVKKEMDEIWHCHEITSPGNFARTFKLPKNVNVEEMKADFENGVLIVSVPKAELKPVNIEISG